jgi:hypothetical protein
MVPRVTEMPFVLLLVLGIRIEKENDDFLPLPTLSL